MRITARTIPYNVHSSGLGQYNNYRHAQGMRSAYDYMLVMARATSFWRNLHKIWLVICDNECMWLLSHGNSDDKRNIVDHALTHNENVTRAIKHKI